MNEQSQAINVRTILSALWISHFLLWTFGDMLSLLQQLSGPVNNDLLLFVAAPLAILQAGVIVFSLIGPARAVRWTNMILVAPFVFFNVGFIAEGTHGWEYLLGAAYLVANALKFWFALKWKTKG